MLISFVILQDLVVKVFQNDSVLTIRRVQLRWSIRRQVEVNYEETSLGDLKEETSWGDL